MNAPEAHNDSQRLIQLLSDNADMDSYEELMRTVFSNAGIFTYSIALYDYKQKDREWVYVKLDRQKAVHSFFYHYERDLAGRVSIPSSHLAAYKRKENIVKAIIEIVYLKQIKKQKIDNTFLRKDLELASKMQRLLIPQNLFNNDQFEVSGLYKPHHQVGGDFYDVYPINEYEIGFCIGDISGKGVNAAIVMANYQALAKSILVSENNLEPVVRRINDKMYQLTEGEKYLTVFIGVYNIRDRRLVYANCGHLPIACYSENEFEWLEKGTTIIGAFSKLPFLEIGEKKITQKTKLLLITDGALNLNYDHEPFLSNSELKYILQNECENLSTQETIAFFEKGIQSIDVEEDMKDDISILSIHLN